MIARMNDAPRIDDAPSADSAQNGDDAARAAYHHGDLRAALVAAALEILSRDGAAYLTLRGVAVQAQVSHAAPRNHFGDFAGLRAAVATEGFMRLGAALRDGMRAADGARSARAEATLTAYVGFATGAPALFRLMFELGPGDDPLGTVGEAMRTALAPLFAAAKGLTLNVIGEPLEGGRSAEFHLWSMVHGHAVLATTGSYLLMHGRPSEGEVLPPDAAALPNTRRDCVEDAQEAEVDGAPLARAAAPRAAPTGAATPDFARIAPKLTFALPFRFETLEKTPGAPTLAAPRARR
jgi:AcrR family transcriptional regulator